MLPIVIPRQIAGTIDPPFRAVGETNRPEYFLRLFGQFPIPGRCLGSGQTQFTRCTLRQEIAVCIQNESTAVVQRPPDGNISIFTLPDLAIGGVNGKFGRPVGVIHLAGDIRHLRHFLTAENDVVKLQRFLNVAQQLTEQRRIGAAGDAVVLDIRPHEHYILARLFRHDIHSAAYRQHGIQILHRRIEGKIGMAGNAALFRMPPPITDKAHKIQQGALRNYNSLGLAGGTGRINHIGARFRHGRAELARHFCPFRFLHQTIIQQQLGFGVIQHIANTFVGAVRINGDIGRSGLPDANRCRHKVLGTTDFDRHKIVGLNRMIDQILRHGVRQRVQFAIGVCTSLIHHRYLFGSFGHLRLEEIQPGFGSIISHFLAFGQSHERRQIRRADPSQGHNGHIRFFDHLRHQRAEYFAHGFHLAPAIATLVKDNMQTELSFVVDKHRR